MTKLDALRRFLLPCFHHTRTAPSPPPSSTKKRLSTSLRDDLDHPTKNPQNPDQENSHHSSPSSSSSASDHAPPRSSRTMVIGTIFGHRRGGHVWFCVQQHRLQPKPTLLLELSIPTSTLIQEMQSGFVRLALDGGGGGGGPLRSVPVWTLFCNGRKLGFAVRRKATQQNKTVLKTMQNVSVGAGVLPGGFGSGSGSEEIMYMRANYEHVVGSADSESFHLINPDDGPGQEFSVFLMRT